MLSGMRVVGRLCGTYIVFIIIVLFQWHTRFPVKRCGCSIIAVNNPGKKTALKVLMRLVGGDDVLGEVEPTLVVSTRLWGRLGALPKFPTLCFTFV